MNINLTLIGQSLAFAFFVWFCLRYIWPPLIAAMRERQTRIADGLAAAERAETDLRLAQKRATEEIEKARQEARQLLEQAGKRADQIVEEAKSDALVEGQRVRESARAEADRELARAREELREQVSTLAVMGAEKILEASVDRQAHARLLDSLAKEI